MISGQLTTSSYLFPVVSVSDPLVPEGRGRESGSAPAQLLVHKNKMHVQMTFVFACRQSEDQWSLPESIEVGGWV